MDQSLEKRFRDFMSQLPFAESIDDLELPRDFDEEKRADFLLDNRNVVVELKSLEKDPEHKVNDELDKQREREDFPLFYGEQELSKILKYLPDGESINRKLFYKISRSVEKAFRKANKQIGSTKKIFNCQNASGFLVLLNQEINVLSPEVLSCRISELLTKPDDDGKCHYKHVASVWIVTENFFLPSRTGMKFLPSIIVDGPTVQEYQDLSEIYNKLQKAWASFNGIPFFDKSEVR